MIRSAGNRRNVSGLYSIVYKIIFRFLQISFVYFFVCVCVRKTFVFGQFHFGIFGI